MSSDIWAESDEEGEPAASGRELNSEWEARKAQYWNVGAKSETGSLSKPKAYTDLLRFTTFTGWIQRRHRRRQAEDLAGGL